MIFSTSSVLHSASILRHEKLEVLVSSQPSNQKNNKNNNQRCNGLDYKSKPFEVSNDTLFFQNIQNLNSHSLNEKDSILKVVPNCYQINKTNLKLAGLKIIHEDSSVSTTHKTNVDNYRFIPYKYKTTDKSSNTSSALSSFQSKNTRNTKDISFSTVTTATATSAALIDTHMSNNNNIMTNNTSLTTTTTTTTIDKYKNKLFILQLLHEEELLCITRGASDIEKFEVKGLLTLNMKLNKNSTLYTTMNKNISSSSAEGSGTGGQIADNSMNSNSISSLFNELHFQDHDNNDTITTTNKNDDGNKNKKKGCYLSMKITLKMTGIANSIEKVDINKHFVQFLPDCTMDDYNDNEEEEEEEEEADKKEVNHNSTLTTTITTLILTATTTTTASPTMMNSEAMPPLNKNNQFVKGLENQYKVETIELPINAGSTATTTTTTHSPMTNNNTAAATTTAVSSYPLVRYHLASHLKFMILKATSLVSLISTSSSGSSSSSTSTNANSSSIASNTNTIANDNNSHHNANNDTTNNKTSATAATATTTTQLKIVIQVRLNPNFRETLSDIYVLASIKKLLKSQSIQTTPSLLPGEVTGVPAAHPGTSSSSSSSSSSIIGGSGSSSSSSGSMLAPIQENSILDHNSSSSSSSSSSVLQSFAISNVSQFTPPTASYNKQEHIITWRATSSSSGSSSASGSSSESGTGGTPPQLSLLTFQAIIDIIPTSSSSSSVPLGMSQSTSISSDTTSSSSSSVNEYKLLTTTVPIIIKAKYQQALITKTKFTIDDPILCDDGQHAIMSSDCFVQDTYRAKLEYRFLEHD